MDAGVLKRIAVATLLVSAVPLPVAVADLETPLKKVEVNKFTCGDFTALGPRAREGMLVYMNGYVDGSRKTTTWHAEIAGKRIDEALRICAANPKSTLLDAFNRAWTPK